MHPSTLQSSCILDLMHVILRRFWDGGFLSLIQVRYLALLYQLELKIPGLNSSPGYAFALQLTGSLRRHGAPKSMTDVNGKKLNGLLERVSARSDAITVQFGGQALLYLNRPPVPSLSMQAKVHEAMMDLIRAYHMSASTNQFDDVYRCLVEIITGTYAYAYAYAYIRLVVFDARRRLTRPGYLPSFLCRARHCSNL